jgi:hypothetical protein
MNDRIRSEVVDFFIIEHKDYYLLPLVDNALEFFPDAKKFALRVFPRPVSMGLEVSAIGRDHLAIPEC